MTQTLYVAMGPRRQGVWAQKPLVDTDVHELADRAAKYYELPAPAVELENWNKLSTGIGNPNVWVYKSNHVRYSDGHDGKHYIYEKKL